MNTSQKEIRDILKNNIELLNWTITPPNGKGYVGITGYRNVITAVYDFDAIGLFKDTIDNLNNTSLMEGTLNTKTFHPNEAQQIDIILQKLKESAINLYQVLLETIPQEDPYSINIKFPPIRDFQDLSTYSRNFHIALTQLIYEDGIDGTTEICSVENGSIWVNVFVKTPTAIAFIASLTWASAVIYKKLKEVDVMEQHIRTLTIKNDTLEDLQKGNKALINQLVELEANHLQEEYFPGKDNEKLERIKNSINLFSDLLFKGAEVHPAIDAPEEVSNLFPDATNLIGIESKVKRITDGKE